MPTSSRGWPVTASRAWSSARWRSPTSYAVRPTRQVAALLDAPITIEDRNSRVLAFSGRQEEADPSRVETVIGRQVPERYARLLTELGVFRELYRQHRRTHAPVSVGT